MLPTFLPVKVEARIAVITDSTWRLFFLSDTDVAQSVESILSSAFLTDRRDAIFCSLVTPKTGHCEMEA